MKNIVALAVGLFVMFALAFSLTTKASAAALSQSQIDAILNMLRAFGADQATIANVQAALTGQPAQNNSGSGSANQGGSTSCTPMVFTLNHKMGDRGGEVKNIQKFLNANGFTVAAAGPGSPGNETDYFGPATKAAVIKFQNAYASEILAPVGLTHGTGYWGPSTRAKANALEQARCAQANQNNNQNNNNNQQQAADELMVAAAAQPANSLAPKGATNVPFTRFTLTAGSSDVTVTGVKVKLQGLAQRSNFDSVVLLDENGMRVGRTRVLQSDYTATIGETMTIPAGQSKTFTVAANIASSVNAGEVASFAVVDIMANKPVNGSLPIVGAQHTLNNTLNVASVSVALGSNAPSVSSLEIGRTNEYLGSVRITNNSSNEDVKLKAVRFYQAGSVAASDLANVKIVIDGNEYPAQVSADGKYYSAAVDVTLPKGLSKDIDIKGDIVSGVGRNIQFQVYEASDIYAVGTLYGYGAPVSGTFPQNAASSVISINGATLNSISKSNDAPAANITVNTPDQVLGAFTVDLMGEGVDVSTLPVTVDIKTGAAVADVAGSITNVTLVDQNGKVLAGPVDITDASGNTETTLNGDEDGRFTFNGVTFPAGKTTVFVKGQLTDTSSLSWTDGNQLQVATDASNWTGVRGTSSGNNVSLTGSAKANVMTVRLPQVDIVTAATPNNNLVAGATNIVLATGELDATTSGDDMRITKIEVRSNASAASVNGKIKNVRVMADTDGDGTYETQLATPQSFPGTAADETLAFPLTQNLVVKKGEKVAIAVYADIASGASGSTTVTFKKVYATGVNTAITFFANGKGTGVSRTIAANGSLTLSVGANNPTSQVLLDGSASNGAEQTIYEFKASASNVEDIEIRGLQFSQTGYSSNSRVLAFDIYAGSDKVASVYNPGSSPVTVDLSSNPVVVPAGSYKTFTIKARTNDILSPVAANNSDNTVSISSVNVTAVGALSQATITPTAVSGDNTDYVYETYPTLAVADAGSSKTLTPAAEMETARITITNNGDKDLTFAGSNEFKPVIYVSQAVTSTAAGDTWKVKDADGTLLCQNAATSGLSAGTNTVTCDLPNTFVVPAGGSKTVVVYVNTTGQTTAGNTVYVKLPDANSTLSFRIDNGTTDYNQIMSVIMNGDITGPTYVKQ